MIGKEYTKLDSTAYDIFYKCEKTKLPFIYFINWKDLYPNIDYYYNLAKQKIRKEKLKNIL
jgi:hypothetical protein